VKVSAGKFISDIMIAMSNCTLYQKEHPAVLDLCGKACRVLDGLFADDRFTIALLDDRLHINEQPFSERSLHLNNFIKKLKRKNVDKVIISRGITAEELKEFIAEIALSPRITGTYPHISWGIIEVKLAAGAGADATAAMSENIEKLKGVYKGASRFKQLDMVGLEDIVVSFITTLRQEVNILKVISPVKAHSEYTYTHNTNVAVLSIFQAQNLGFGNEVLHDIGLAGLLHDMGKMFVSKEVLEKQGQLSDREWEEMRKHPTYGAMYLATLPEIPKYALVAAYEHHMKFDGRGYPQTRRKAGRQHIISQIISISDFFDALRADRPYRKSVEPLAIIGLLTESSGKDFNPYLVENFVHAFKRVTAVSP
jgi:HD-GYP domain-containing protein (c-di-GMP phosphodiesterase class II)